jgi:hypothetical protein
MPVSCLEIHYYQRYGLLHDITLGVAQGDRKLSLIGFNPLASGWGLVSEQFFNLNEIQPNPILAPLSKK